MLVAPGATAALLVRRVGPMMWLAALFALVSGFGGLYASYYLNTAAGASIAGATVILYALAAAGSWIVNGLRRQRTWPDAVRGHEPGYARTP
jgi:ABC-type Mn2+/Zn2+ transport system permease subunit